MAQALNVAPPQPPRPLLRQELNRLTLQPLGLAAAVLLILLVSVWSPMVHEDHAFDHTYVQQAIAFAHGHTSVATAIFDTAEKDGRVFVVFPPGPALFLLPFAALWGIHVRVLLLTALVGAVTALLAFRLA